MKRTPRRRYWHTNLSEMAAQTPAAPPVPAVSTTDVEALSKLAVLLDTEKWSEFCRLPNIDKLVMARFYQRRAPPLPAFLRLVRSLLEPNSRNEALILVKIWTDDPKLLDEYIRLTHSFQK